MRRFGEKDTGSGNSPIKAGQDVDGFVEGLLRRVADAGLLRARRPAFPRR